MKCALRGVDGGNNSSKDKYDEKLGSLTDRTPKVTNDVALHKRDSLVIDAIYLYYRFGSGRAISVVALRTASYRPSLDAGRFFGGPGGGSIIVRGMSFIAKFPNVAQQILSFSLVFGVLSCC